MKAQILVPLMVLVLIYGCAERASHMGASPDKDQNVLTGGPVTGTRLADLPQTVRDTLKEQAPNAEIADIDKERRGDQTIYRFTFSRPAYNPTLYISEDGHVLGPSNRERLEKKSNE